MDDFWIDFQEDQKNQAIELYQNQDYEELVEFCKTILNTEPNNRSAIFLIAVMYNILELWDGCAEHYQKLKELDVEFNQEDQHNLALALCRCHRYEEALPEVELALKLPSDDGMENTEKLYNEIKSGLEQNSDSPKVNIRMYFDKDVNAWMITLKNDDQEQHFQVKSVTPDEFKPILELRNEHTKLEESGGVDNLTAEQENEIYRKWFETVLSIGLEDYSADLLTKLSIDELHALSADVFVSLNRQQNPDGPTSEDLRNNFERYSWQQMEDLVGELFEKKGYSVQVGVSSKAGMKRSGDFGIDVRASNDIVTIGIQVKHHSSNVDFDTLAKTLGVSQDYDKVLVINTKTGFTKQALTFAEGEKKLDLWDYQKFNEEIESNFH